MNAISRAIASIKSTFPHEPTMQAMIENRNPLTSQNSYNLSRQKLKEEKCPFADKEQLKMLCSAEYFNPAEDGLLSLNDVAGEYARTMKRATEAMTPKDDGPSGMSHALLYATMAEWCMRMALSCSHDDARDHALDAISDTRLPDDPPHSPLPTSAREHDPATECIKTFPLADHLPGAVRNRVLSCCDALLGDKAQEDIHNLFSVSEVFMAEALIAHEKILRSFCLLREARRHFHIW